MGDFCDVLKNYEIQHIFFLKTGLLWLAHSVFTKSLGRLNSVLQRLISASETLNKS